MAEHAGVLGGKLVVEATNEMGTPVTNSRAALPSDVRYARAFNTLGGQNLASPDFGDGPADMFFSAPESDRASVETVIEDVGLRPIYGGRTRRPDRLPLAPVGALAVTQGRGPAPRDRLLDGSDEELPEVGR